MGSYFGDALRAHREAKGISGYLLAKRSGISNPTLNQIELGKRPPSESNMQAIASVEEMGVTMDILKTWADLDRIGPEGVERLKRVFALEMGVAGISENATPDPVFTGRPWDNATHPPTADEKAIISGAESIGLKLDSLYDPDFWNRPITQRMPTLLWVDGLVKMEKARQRDGS